MAPRVSQVCQDQKEIQVRLEHRGLKVRREKKVIGATRVTRVRRVHQAHKARPGRKDLKVRRGHRVLR